MAERGSPSPAAAATPTDQLAPRSLPSGECAVFLWTTENKPRFVGFMPVGPGESALYWQGREQAARLALPLTEPDLGISPDLTMTLASGTDVRLALSKREDIEQGVRYGQGTLKIGDAAQDQTVMPVAAISTCQS